MHFSDVEVGKRLFVGNGQPKAKYLSYLIYGNMILMCPGYNVEDSRTRCSERIYDIIPEARPVVE